MARPTHYFRLVWGLPAYFLVALLIVPLQSVSAKSLITTSNPSAAELGNQCKMRKIPAYCRMKDDICDTADDLYGYGTSYINGAADLFGAAANAYAGGNLVSEAAAGNYANAAAGGVTETAGAIAGSVAGTLGGAALTVGLAAAGLANIAAGSELEDEANKYLDKAKAASQGEKRCTELCAWLTANCP